MSVSAMPMAMGLCRGWHCRGLPHDDDRNSAVITTGHQRGNHAVVAGRMRGKAIAGEAPFQPPPAGDQRDKRGGESTAPTTCATQ